MAMTTMLEFRNMETDELEHHLTEIRQEAFNLRFQLVTGQLDNYARITQVRREIARVETILREREIEAAEAVGAVEPEASVEIEMSAEAGVDEEQE